MGYPGRSGAGAGAGRAGGRGVEPAHGGVEEALYALLVQVGARHVGALRIPHGEYPDEDELPQRQCHLGGVHAGLIDLHMYVCAYIHAGNTIAGCKPSIPGLEGRKERK